MAAVELRGLDEVSKYLTQIPAESFSAFRKVFSGTILRIQNKVADNASQGPLFSRTGELARSIRSTVSGKTIDALQAKVFTDSKYAPIHEEGGTIKAKNAYKGLLGGPFLNIPSDANKTPAGVMRFSAREIFATGGFIIKIASFRAKYAVMSGAGIPMFWLVSSVNIKARLGMIEAAEDEVPTFLSTLSSTLEKALQ